MRNPGPRPFLTASWRRLILAQYEADRALLEPALPRGLTLDTWEGRVYVSFVAFEFLDTRVLGCRVPGSVDFPEVNLRFYVRDSERRGVCFVREFVPSRLTAVVARRVYNEPYARADMHASCTLGAGSVTIEHRFAFGGARHTISAEVHPETAIPAAGSLEHHFKEHEWGFGRTRDGEPTVYRVEHPVWATHRVRRSRIDVDAEALYGPAWAWLSDREPDSVIVAAGSGVAVHPWSRRGQPSSTSFSTARTIRGPVARRR